jgi:hypothetical protein
MLRSFKIIVIKNINYNAYTHHLFLLLIEQVYYIVNYHQYQIVDVLYRISRLQSIYILVHLQRSNQLYRFLFIIMCCPFAINISYK